MHGLLLAPLLFLTLAVPPAPAGRVSDYANLLAADARGRLESRLAERERATGVQMAIAIFSGLEGESLEDFSIRLAQQWRIGRKGLDSGVILLVFVRDRKVRMEVGYGLEAQLPDSVAAQIIRQEIGPRFREQRYIEGLEAAADAVFARIAPGTVPPPAPAQRRQRTSSNPYVLLFFLLAAGVLGALWFDARRQRGGYAAHGRGWGSSGSGGPWFGGGGSSSSGGGSSDSGFSGGGGDFGGGGASGDW